MAPESCTSLWKMRPAWRRPGNMSIWSVMRAPAESTRYTSGMRILPASSWMRRIFSTVRAPHDPAFTVESLAMTATGRPWTRPTPVTTPSAGRSGASQLARSPSSVNSLPASNRSSSRRRQKSLPSSAFFLWYFSAPPARAFSARAASSAAECSWLICRLLARAGSALRVARLRLAPGSRLSSPALARTSFPLVAGRALLGERAQPLGAVLGGEGGLVALAFDGEPGGELGVEPAVDRLLRLGDADRRAAGELLGERVHRRAQRRPVGHDLA